jgi:hypothetical protein
VQPERLFGVHQQGGVVVAEVHPCVLGDDVGERREHLGRNAFGVLRGERQILERIVLARAHGHRVEHRVVVGPRVLHRFPGGADKIGPQCHDLTLSAA